MKDWTWLDAGAAPQGFRASGVRAGIKTAGPDLALIVSNGDAVGATVFTQNQFCAPPVIVSREHAADGRLRAIFANSGCANCATGGAGIEDAREMARLAGAAVGCEPEEVLVASTGIIGRTLPMDLVRAGVPKAAQELSPAGFAAAAEAIMTTDTAPKHAALQVEIAGQPVTISGMVKGAGMVAPRMATVFGFFATDARIEHRVLQPLLGRVMDRSLNRVTVDGDTSTNDTACILASGAVAGPALEPDTTECERFEAAFTALAQHLAKRMAREGEGANHLVTVHVRGALTEPDAETVAFSIANSPLVKTALFGRDANWGRIAMAAGKAGVLFDQRRVDITLNGYAMARGGVQAPFDPQQLYESLGQEEVTIEVNLNQGSAEATTWTCDFSYDYVKINADYHT